MGKNGKKKYGKRVGIIHIKWRIIKRLDIFFNVLVVKKIEKKKVGLTIYQRKIETEDPDQIILNESFI